MKTIYKEKKSSKKDLFARTALELRDIVKSYKFDTKICRDAQEFALHLESYKDNPSAFFNEALGYMRLEDVKNMVDIMKTESRSIRGGTEIKVEAISQVILGKMLGSLNQYIDECVTVKHTILASIINLYANLTMKGDRFDNSIFIDMLKKRLVALEPKEDVNELTDMLSKFTLG